LLCFPPDGPKGAAFSSLSLGLGPRLALVAGLVFGGVVEESVGRGLAFWKSNATCQSKSMEGDSSSLCLMRTYNSEGAASTEPVS
jgi:hypothetical protein